MKLILDRQSVMRLFAGVAPARACRARAAGHGWFARVIPEHLRVRRRWLQLFGWPGVVAAGLLAACPAFYLSAIHPARVRLEEARRGAASVQERVRLAEKGLGGSQLPPAEQLARFYAIFPKEKELLPWLKKVFDLAQAQGIRLDEGEYKLVRDKVGKLARFQMTLPVKSAYPQIRRYLNSLRADVPVVALEHLQFERQRVSDPEVEAKLRIALYVEEGR